jgi:hypothetical protein
MLLCVYSSVFSDFLERLAAGVSDAAMVLYGAECGVELSYHASMLHKGHD